VSRRPRGAGRGTSVLKTGFPLELRVASFLRSVDYHVATNVYFVDKDEEKGREVDIRALKNKSIGTKRAVRHCLVIECKKALVVRGFFLHQKQYPMTYDQSISEIRCRGINFEQWNTALA
jgi:hypothetical protein